MTTALTDQRRVLLARGGPTQHALVGAGLRTGQPVVVLIGGAAKLGESAIDVSGIIRDGIVATAQAHGATIVDGGTDAGVMALAGQARRDLGATVPLVGVAPAGKVTAANIASATGSTELEPNHTHLLLSPTDEWGSEAPYLINTAKLLGSGGNVVAVLVDGGPLALQEAMACAAEGWPLIVVAGSGRTADVLATYTRGSNARALSGAHPGSIHVVELSAGSTALAETLGALLRGKPVPQAPSPLPGAPTKIDYPALYVAASGASRRGQRSFKALHALELGLTLFALLLGLTGGIAVAALTPAKSVQDLIDNGVAGFSALAFLLALLVRVLNHSAGYDDEWFKGRSIAETVKSLSWRYMAGIPPYNGSDADGRLTTDLGALLDSSTDLHQAVDSLPTIPTQISAAMKDVHQRPFAERRAFYIKWRLLDQAQWYRRRSSGHRHAATRWFWIAIVFQTLAVVIALVALLSAVYGFAVAQTPLLRAMSLLASIAIAVTAWTQLNRDDELAKNYAVTLQQLLLIASSAERAATDEDFADAVRDGEEAIGRENQVWVAKRVERHQSPEFGHSD